MSFLVSSLPNLIYQDDHCYRHHEFHAPARDSRLRHSIHPRSISCSASATPGSCYRLCTICFSYLSYRLTPFIVRKGSVVPLLRRQSSFAERSLLFSFTDDRRNPGKVVQQARVYYVVRRDVRGSRERLAISLRGLFEWRR